MAVDDVHPGHLHRFGSSGPFHETNEVVEFPSTTEFFSEYVFERRPLKMIGAARRSPAYSLWTDDYLLSVDHQGEENDENGDYRVNVEIEKKENRTGPSWDLTFNEFIRVYHDKELYMVEVVPPFLRQDVFLPAPLQCRQIFDGLIVEMVMWMSSGGTSSVVHTDSVDNIICLIDGEKNFILVDPDEYGDALNIDHPEEGYSSIDVDRVDYALYPGLRNVTYYTVNLTAGDCFYIPHKWIHQVRSYNRNIAVNVWWSHERSFDIDLTACEDEMEFLSRDDVTFNVVTVHSSSETVNEEEGSTEDNDRLNIADRTDYDEDEDNEYSESQPIDEIEQYEYQEYSEEEENMEDSQHDRRKTYKELSKSEL